MAPFLTNSAAVALPMPLAPPVITATFPANLRESEEAERGRDGLPALPAAPLFAVLHSQKTTSEQGSEHQRAAGPHQKRSYLKRTRINRNIFDEGQTVSCFLAQR